MEHVFDLPMMHLLKKIKILGCSSVVEHVGVMSRSILTTKRKKPNTYPHCVSDS